MGLESATYVSALNSANPQSTDAVSFGDDHLRLLKSVLQSSFPDVDQAIATVVVKATAPTTQVKGTIWYDTSASALKINTAATGSSPSWVSFGAAAPWESTDSVASQTGNSGKILTTDGSSTSWSSIYTGANGGYRSFSVTKGGTNQTIPANTNEKVTWGTEEFDVGGVFASDKFTCDVAGKYHFYAAVKYTSSALYDNVIWFYKNGSQFRHANYFIAYDSGANTGRPTMQLEANLDLAVNDYIEVFVHQESGGTLDVDGSTQASWFTGYRIG